MSPNLIRQNQSLNLLPTRPKQSLPKRQSKAMKMHELVDLNAPVAENDSVEVVDSTLWLKELAGTDDDQQRQDTGLELQEIFEELKENTGDLKPLMDFETHYNLGLAYKDMDVLDDAIEQFQMAFRMAGEEESLKSELHSVLPHARRLLQAQADAKSRRHVVRARAKDRGPHRR